MNSLNHDPHSRTSFRLPYPKGFLRLVMRFPILLYRLRLGWLLGKRFLLLEHRGRRSGELKRAVIEVVDQDADGSYIVAAAWGAQSDWFKNILATPDVHVIVSARRFPATAGQISENEAERHLRAYAERNPFAFTQLGSLLIGQSTRSTDDVVQAFTTSIPFVKFSPIRTGVQG